MGESVRGAFGVKQRLKLAYYRALKKPRLEGLIVRMIRQVRDDPKLLGSVIKLTPHPYAYTAGETREVIRNGLRWKLQPSHYFQWHQYYGLRDRVLETLLILAQGKQTVIDVGANIGFYSVVLAATDPSRVRLYSFEPHPVSYAALTGHVALNGLRNVFCVNKALGLEPGVLTLQDMGNGDLGKFSLRDQQKSGVQVEVDTLDRFVRENVHDRVDLIKIDVEGFEPEVLKGAEATIQRDWPLLCIELTPRWSRDKTDLLLDCVRLWRQGGYRFFSIQPDGYDPFDFLATFSSHASNVAAQYNIIAVDEATSLRLEHRHRSQ